MLGLHHFYTGNRRRGWWYLACCWLLFPMLLGWIDAVRLALLDDEGFREHVDRHAVPTVNTAGALSD
jgi:TM2 domain-containing membrane protein YozV